MFTTMMAIAMSFFGADPQSHESVNFLQIPYPRLESIEQRIHVAKSGKWTFQSKVICQFQGVEPIKAAGFVERVNSQFFSGPLERFIRNQDIKSLGDARWQSMIETECSSMLLLALMLNENTIGMNDESFSWNQTTFKLKTRQANEILPPQQNKTDEENDGFLLFGALNSTTFARAIRELRELAPLFEKDDVGEDRLLVLHKLTLTTDGKITADAPAEISPDGMTMVIDYTDNKNFFAMMKRETWSLRIDDL